MFTVFIAIPFTSGVFLFTMSGMEGAVAGTMTITAFRLKTVFT
jgi:hypothetical protein